MFVADNGAVAQHIVVALLQELDARAPGLAKAVEARLNSAAKNPEEGATLADRQEAGRIVGALTI